MTREFCDLPFSPVIMESFARRLVVETILQLPSWAALMWKALLCFPLLRSLSFCLNASGVCKAQGQWGQSHTRYACQLVTCRLHSRRRVGVANKKFITDVEPGGKVDERELETVAAVRGARASSHPLHLPGPH